MWNDAYEFFTSDAGKQCCTHLWSVFMLLTGGTGLAVCQWFLTVVFGRHKQEVKRLIDAIKEGEVTPHTVTRVVPDKPSYEDTVLRIVGTKICIDDSVKIPWRGPIGNVIAYDGVDQSNVYSRNELKQILTAAKWKRKQLIVRDRDAQRQLLASHIPSVGKPPAVPISHKA